MVGCMEDALNLVTTLQALIDEENERTANAADRLGIVVPIAQQGLKILNTAILSVDRGQGITAAFILAIQKCLTLAFLSHVRGHLIQAEFNCRHAIELTALGAYMLANPDADIFDQAEKENEDGFVLKSRKAIWAQAIKWLENAEPELNLLLKDFKEQINDSTAHGSIYATHFTIDHDTLSADGERFLGTFFDNLSLHDTRVYLLSFARLVLLIVETIRRANQRSEMLVLRPDLERDLYLYAHILDDYRNKIGATPREPGAGDVQKR